ncbi:YbjQ family protein [Maribacter algarum]|uniref:YbjQ family protein n=1 Tax=Maribacter algarum (ex Zhang et al. 2020) TaxID=2578118 RepID=A0A5S3PSQ6_9FLAO|nr:YbjQ family protein [Maribacter algarum]TMM57983.1 YbjQ family protein [Maribacter algarum]
MILTTTNTIEGKSVSKYLGIVTGTTYVTYEMTKMSFKDMFKQKKYYEAYEKGLEEAKEEAFQKLKDNAERLNANAIIGISVDVESVSGSMYTMVSVVGTAAVII